MASYRKKHTIKRFLTTAGFIIGGLGLSALHTWLKPHGVEPHGWLGYGLTLLDHASVALFAAPILGVIIELPHMSHYFRGLIEQTIMQKDYLKDLNTQALDQMKQKCLEAFFEIEQLDKGFYGNFYREKLEKQIGNPYRIGTKAKTIVKIAADSTTLDVEDEITYTCKKVGKDIQKQIEWTTRPDEIYGVTSLKFEVKRPDQQNSCIYSYTASPASLIQPAGIKMPMVVKPSVEGHGCTLDLSDYKGCDNLTVTIKVSYRVPRGRAFCWTMPYLSNGFNCSIEFPASFQIFVDSFGIEQLEEKSTLVSEGGTSCYSFNYENWLLPDDGFAFHFRDIPAADSSGTAATGN